MICVSSKLRRLVETCCTAALILPNMTVSSQAQIADHQIDIKKAHDEYYLQDNLFNKEHWAGLKSIFQRFRADRVGERQAIAEENMNYQQQRNKRFTEYEAKVSQIGSRTPLNPVLAATSANPGAVSKTSPPAVAPGVADAEFQKHQKWIADQDRKEREREAAALKMEFAPARAAGEPSTLNQNSNAASNKNDSKRSLQVNDTPANDRYGDEATFNPAMPAPKDYETYYNGRKSDPNVLTREQFEGYYKWNDPSDPGSMTPLQLEIEYRYKRKSQAKADAQAAADAARVASDAARSQGCVENAIGAGMGCGSKGEEYLKAAAGIMLLGVAGAFAADVISEERIAKMPPAEQAEARRHKAARWEKLNCEMERDRAQYDSYSVARSCVGVGED